MRAILWLTMVTMGMAVPASGMSELETLRERCAQQERQIRRLKAENERLREGKSEASATSARSTRETDSTKATKTASARTETKADSPKSTASKNSKTASSGGSGGGTCTVRQGDSFDRIAHKNGTTAEKVAEANNLELTAIIHPGQKLVLPPKGSSRSSSAGRSAAHAADAPATRTQAGPKPAKSSSPDDPKPAKAIAQADPKPAIDAEDDPSVADPPPAVPKAPATAAVGHAKAPGTPPADTDTPAASPPTTKSVDKKKTHAVKIENEMTYGQFAAKHGTDTKHLNDLNGLDLTKSAVLAKGSELYVPGHP